MLIFPSFFNAGQAGSYEIEQSLRIAQGSYLYRTNSSSGNTYTWTYSCWVKRGTFTQAIDAILAANQNYGNDWDSDSLQFHTGNFGLQIYNNRNQSTRASGTTNAKYKDPSAWMHIVAVWDNTNSTAADKFRYYINGERATIAWNTTPTGDSSLINSTTTMRIGQNASVNSEKYMSEVHFIDGTAVTNALDFGEYDNNGVWRPIEYTGSYGTNGFYLKFDPSATNGIGHDHSGNGNHWSPQNIVTSGTGTDVMSDTPTTNWCTLNAADPIITSLAEGNLKTLGPGAAWGHSRSTFAMSSGKWYWEDTVTWDGGNYTHTGVVKAEAAFDNNVGQNAHGWGFRTADGKILNQDVPTSYGSGVSSGTVLGIAFDADTGKMWVRNASGYYNSGDPVAGTNPAMTAGAGTYFAAGSGYQSSSQDEFNFGQRAFAYTPPTNFLPLNTANLPAPTVKDGSKNFNTVLYSGNGSTQSITGVGFQPDWSWIKVRTEAYSHDLYDAVRGVQKSLASNGPTAEVTQTAGLSSFDTDGFSLGDRWNVNKGSTTYVSWNWLAGGSGSSNTDGSITSTVSANPSAGFSIVSYTGTGANATVGHGLGVAPSMIILKNRDDGTLDWPVYHRSLGATKRLILSTTAAAGTDGNIFWNSTDPSSTNFSVGTVGNTNGNGKKMIAYCFAEVEGYSKISSYTGNGSSDGTFVYTGFAPAFLLIGKTSPGAGWNWQLRDSKRPGYNVNNDELRANSDAAELSSSAETIDFLSNGFKPRSANGATNQSGYTYIYLALAENPFGGSGVSPATAR